METDHVRQALDEGSRVRGAEDALFAEARNPRKWAEIRHAAYYREMVDDVRATAKGMYQNPIPALTYSAFKQFDTTGSRTSYQEVYFARRRRLNVFAFLVLLDGDDESLEALEDALWTICDEYTWCLPAHLGGHSLQAEAEAGHRYAIDLFAAETGFTLAEIMALVGDRISAVISARIRREVMERILESFCERDSFYHWETSEMNWASVCGGAVGAAALYLVQDNEALAPIVYRLNAVMESYLRGFQADGACTEGSQYWSYGFGFFIYYAELLKQRTAGMMDLVDNEKVRQIALFHQRSYLTGNHVVPFSDTELVCGHSVGLIHALKRQIAEVQVPELCYRLLPSEDPVGRWAPFIRDFVWSNKDWTGVDWLDTVDYMSNAQWLVSRFSDQAVQYAFAAKGGHNDEPHNHNDVGSFVYHIGGETLLADLGSGEYTKAYFGDERYSFLPTRSRGHSVPIINGKEQLPGGKFAARDIQFEDGEQQLRFSLNIAGAYGIEHLSSLVRTFTINKLAPHTLLLEDRYIFQSKPSSVVERFVSSRKPTIESKGYVRIQGAKHSVLLRYDAALLHAEVHEITYRSKFSQNVTAYALDLAVIRPKMEQTLTIWMISA